MPKNTNRIRAYLLYGIGPVIALAAWWLATREVKGSEVKGSLEDFNIADSGAALWDLLFGAPFLDSHFWGSVAQTLTRLGVGMGIAVGVGVPIGLLTGYFRPLQQASYVPFQFFRLISPLSWTPVAIIVLGIGSGPVYFLVAVAAVWPMIINTAAGVRSVDPRWIQVARCLGAGDRQVMRHVVMRATLVSVLVGFQLALGVAWIVIVPAEMLGVSGGLGYMILDFRDVGEYASIMALILFIGAMGVALDWPIRKAIEVVSWE